MKRFSVLYLLNEQYHHVGCNTQTEAQSVLHKLAADKKRKPVGIYDSKTELFEWEPSRQLNYEQASIGEQGDQGNRIITIAQSLRRRDAGWLPVGDLHRPSLFA
jgi:hypothetical protein